MLVVNAAAICVTRVSGSEGGTRMTLQVDRMVGVQGETLPVVLGHFPFRVEGGHPGGSCFLSGGEMLVAGDVEQVHGPAGQEPAVLPAFGHAPHQRGDPAAPPQGAQHPSYPLLVQAQHRGKVGHAGQGYPGGYFQKSSLFVGE